MKIDQLLSSTDSQKIVQAIAQAEEQTNGEIRVHIEEIPLTQTPMQRAIAVFNALNMQQTEQRTGVLFYVNATERALVILGDEGINTLVTADFWEQINTTMLAAFKNQAYTQGICQGILMAGEKLAAFFPKTPNNKNELPNQISTHADIHI